MLVEAKIKTLGLVLPDLDEIYRTNRSGARFPRTLRCRICSISQAPHR